MIWNNLKEYKEAYSSDRAMPANETDCFIYTRSPLVVIDEEQRFPSSRKPSSSLLGFLVVLPAIFGIL